MAVTYPRTKRGIFQVRESASWGADSGDWTYLKVKEQAFPTGLEYQEGDDTTQYDTEDVGSLLVQPGDVTFKMGLHPAVSSWPTTKPLIANLPPIGKPLKSLMGLATAGGRGVTTTGNTTTVLQFDIYGDTPTDMGFVEGDPVFVRAAAGSNVHGANAIEDVDDVAYTITLRSPLPSAPGDACIVYGGFGFPKIATDVSVPLDFRWLGEAAYDMRKALSGLPASASISAPYRGLAELAMTFRCARPIPPDAAESGGGVSQQTYAYPETSQVISGGLYHWDGSTNRKLTGGVDIDFGVELAEAGGINGVDPNGIAAMVLSARKIRVKVKPEMTSTGYALWDIYQNPPDVSVLTGWWGVGPRVWMFQVPQAVVVNCVRGDDSGKVILEADFGAAAYSGDTGTPSETTGVDAPFVLGVLAGAAS